MLGPGSAAAGVTTRPAPTASARSRVAADRRTKRNSAPAAASCAMASRSAGDGCRAVEPETEPVPSRGAGAGVVRGRSGRSTTHSVVPGVQRPASEAEGGAVSGRLGGGQPHVVTTEQGGHDVGRTGWLVVEAEEGEGVGEVERGVAAAAHRPAGEGRVGPDVGQVVGHVAEEGAVVLGLLAHQGRAVAEVQRLVADPRRHGAGVVQRVPVGLGAVGELEHRRRVASACPRERHSSMQARP